MFKSVFTQARKVSSRFSGRGKYHGNVMPRQVQKRNLLFILTAISITLYLGWRTFFTLPFGYGIPSMVVASILLFCEIVAGLEALEQYLTMINIREPEMPVIPSSWYPHIDVLIATHNEGADILYKTINAITHFEYPDRSKLHVYLCGDNNRPEMKALADEFGIGYFGLSGNKLAKAGNLNNAIFKTTSPLVVTFDADMIPRSTFLMQSVPYFFLPYVKKTEDGVWVPREKDEIDLDYKVGFVQTTQSFYNPDLFQYNLYSEARVPNEQDYFSREINIGRNRNNSPLYTGSNTVLSREALTKIGGIASGTLTEDFETGLRIQALGYKTYAISKILAHGLAPHSITGLLAQRERWGRGCVQALRNVKLFRIKTISLSAKLSYFTCLIYWWAYTRMFVYIITPILTALFHFHVVECTLTQLALFWLPYYILGDMAMKTLSGGVRNQHWNNLIYTTFFPYLISPIVLETVGFKLDKFIVTKKKADDAPSGTHVLAYPHILLLGASIVALIMCLRQMIDSASLHTIVIAFWLVVNGKNLVFAIFFMFGRKNLRKADRFYVSLPIKIEAKGKIFEGFTTDVSETGLSVRTNFPVYLPDDEPFIVHISTNKYHAAVECVVVHVDEREQEESWRYCLHVVGMDEENRREYFQIVFDRMHTLPSRILDTLTMYDDFNLNVGHRLEPDARAAIRKLPRIRLGVQGECADGREVLIEDFNYKFAWVKGEALPQDEPFVVEIGNGMLLELQVVSEIKREGHEGQLCHVLNWKALLDNGNFQKMLRSRLDMADTKMLPLVPTEA